MQDCRTDLVPWEQWATTWGGQGEEEGGEGEGIRGGEGKEAERGRRRERQEGRRGRRRSSSSPSPL